MEPYLGLAEFKTAIGQTGREWDDQITTALNAATAWIGRVTNDRFAPADPPFAKRIRAANPRRLTVGSFHTLDDLVVEVDYADTDQWVTVPAEQWSAARIMHAADESAPYDTLLARPPLRWPDGRSLAGYAALNRGWVRVTARWGWAVPPGEVVDACQIVAAGLFEARMSSGGFAAAVRGLTGQGAATPEYVLQGKSLIEPLLRPA